MQKVRSPVCSSCRKKSNYLAGESLVLLERISLAGIARALEVSQVWLQGYISKLYAACPDDLCADLPHQAAMQAHLKDKFDNYIYEISPLKKHFSV